jgi:CBS domain-containing protein
VLMPNTIMTEKIARRGVRVPAEYEPDFLDGVLVADVVSKNLVTLPADWSVQKVREWINSDAAGNGHQGYPVVGPQGYLVGILTRRDLLNPSNSKERLLGEMILRPPIVVHPDVTLREAADHMVNHDIGRLPVIERQSARLIGIITRSDLLSAHRGRIKQSRDRGPGIRLTMGRFRRDRDSQNGNPKSPG